jgi:hypothetical protein
LLKAKKTITKQIPQKLRKEGNATNDSTAMEQEQVSISHHKDEKATRSFFFPNKKEKPTFSSRPFPRDPFAKTAPTAIPAAHLPAPPRSDGADRATQAERAQRGGANRYFPTGASSFISLSPTSRSSPPGDASNRAELLAIPNPPPPAPAAAAAAPQG